MPYQKQFQDFRTVLETQDKIKADAGLEGSPALPGAAARG